MTETQDKWGSSKGHYLSISEKKYNVCSTETCHGESSKGHYLSVWKKKYNVCSTETCHGERSKGHYLCIWKRKVNGCSTETSDVVERHDIHRGHYFSLRATINIYNGDKLDHNSFLT
jgi:putative lipoic acid-binding regulatory protein